MKGTRGQVDVYLLHPEKQGLHLVLLKGSIAEKREGGTGDCVRVMLCKGDDASHPCRPFLPALSGVTLHSLLGPGVLGGFFIVRSSGYICAYSTNTY